MMIIPVASWLPREGEHPGVPMHEYANAIRRGQGVLASVDAEFLGFLRSLRPLYRDKARLTAQRS
jgi:hypothetical protein